MITDFFRATEVTDDVDLLIEDCMNPFTFDGVKSSKVATVRKALVEAVKVIVANVPPCPTRTVAIRKLIEAKMDCASAVAHDGRY